jgi:hypothetical protein
MQRAVPRDGDGDALNTAAGVVQPRFDELVERLILRHLPRLCEGVTEETDTRRTDLLRYLVIAIDVPHEFTRLVTTSPRVLWYIIVVFG